MSNNKKFEEITVCKHCGDQIQNITKGDEGWFYCAGCKIVEPDTEDKFLCLSCEEIKDEEVCDCSKKE